MTDPNPQDFEAAKNEALPQHGQRAFLIAPRQQAIGLVLNPISDPGSEQVADPAWHSVSDSDSDPVSATVSDADPDSTTPAVAENKQPSPAPNVNRTYAYGAVAAVFGTIAGIAIASFAGGAHHNLPSASAAVNSQAAGLAAMIPAPVVAPVEATAPVDATQSAKAVPAFLSKPVHHRRANKKALDAPSAFAIEGDDELVGYDPSKGVIETSARKTFIISKSAGGDASSRWQDSQANIHYKCDQNANCTLSRKGAAVIYAQLKK
jgi:hypothetical protein